MRKDVFDSIEREFATVMTSPGAVECFEAYTDEDILPEYIMAYVRGIEPRNRAIKPMTESFDFMRLDSIG